MGRELDHGLLRTWAEVPSWVMPRETEAINVCHCEV